MYIKYRALFNRGSIDGVGHVAPKLAVAVGSSLGRGKAGSLAAVQAELAVQWAVMDDWQ